MFTITIITKKATIHQVTTMLAISKIVLFPGQWDHNQLLTASIDDPSLAGARAIITSVRLSVSWLAGGYNLEIGHF